MPEHQLRDGAQIAPPDYFNYFLNIDVKVSPNSGLPWHVTVIHAMGSCFIGCMRLESCWVRFPARMLATTKGPLRQLVDENLWNEGNAPVLTVQVGR